MPNERRKKLYDALHGEGYYTKSYEEFENQFSSDQSRERLHKTLADNQWYTKSFGDFESQFYSDPQGESIASVEKKSPYGSDSSLGVGPSASLSGNSLEQALLAGKSNAPVKKLETAPLSRENRDPLGIATSAIGKTVEDKFNKDVEDRRTSLAQMDTGQSRKSSALNGALQSLTSSFAAVPKTISILANKLDDLAPDWYNDQDVKAKNPEEYLTGKAAKYIEDTAKELFPTNPAYQDDFWTNIVPQAGGQALSFLAGAVAPKLANKVLTKTAVGTLSPQVSTAFQGASMQASSQYDEALAATGDREKAFDAFLYNLPLGLTDMIPVARFLKRVDKFSGGSVAGAVKQIAKQGAENFTEEFLQKIGENVIASKTYDDNRDFLDNAFTEGAAGGVIGAVLAGASFSVKNKLASPDLSASEKKDSQKTLDLIEEKQADLESSPKLADDADLQSVQQEAEPQSPSRVLTPTSTQSFPRISEPQNEEANSDQRQPAQQPTGDPLAETNAQTPVSANGNQPGRTTIPDASTADRLSSENREHALSEPSTPVENPPSLQEARQTSQSNDEAEAQTGTEASPGFRSVESAKFNTIADKLSRFPKDSFARHGDTNVLKGQMQIQANYFSKKGLPIDVQAQQMSYELNPNGDGTEISPEDIVEFVNTYPGGAGQYKNKVLIANGQEITSGKRKAKIIKPAQQPAYDSNVERIFADHPELTGEDLLDIINQSGGTASQKFAVSDIFGDLYFDELAALEELLKQRLNEQSETRPQADNLPGTSNIEGEGQGESRFATPIGQTEGQGVNEQAPTETQPPSETGAGLSAANDDSTLRPSDSGLGVGTGISNARRNAPNTSQSVPADFESRIANIQQRRNAAWSRIRAKSSNKLSSGIDPNLLSDLIEVGLTYIEEGSVRGLNSFKQFKKQLKEDYKEFTGNDIADEDVEDVYDKTIAVYQERERRNTQDSGLQENKVADSGNEHQSDERGQLAKTVEGKGPKRERGVSIQLRTKANVASDLAEHAKKDPMLYQQLGNAASWQQASVELQEILKDDLSTSELLTSLKSTGTEDLTRRNLQSMMVSRMFNDLASETDDPALKKQYLEQAFQIIDATAERSTLAGQGTQVLILLDQNTPEGLQYSFSKAVDKWRRGPTPKKDGKPRPPAQLQKARKAAKELADDINAVAKKVRNEGSRSPNDRQPSTQPIVAKETTEEQLVKKRLIGNVSKAKALAGKLFSSTPNTLQSGPINPEIAQQLYDVTSDILADLVRLGRIKLNTTASEAYAKVAKQIGADVALFSQWAEGKKIYESVLDQSDMKAVLDSRVAEEVKEAAEKRIQKLLKINKARAPKAAPLLAERVAELASLGVLTEEAVMDLDGFAARFGVPTMTAEVAEGIAQRAKKMQSLPEGSRLREEARDDVVEYMSKQFPVRKFDRFWSLYYPAVLSGVSTHLQNVLANAGNVLSEGLATAARVRYTDTGLAFGAAELMDRVLVYVDAFRQKRTIGESRILAHRTLTHGVKSNKYGDTSVQNSKNLSKSQSIEDLAKASPKNPYYRILKYVPRFLEAEDAVFSANFKQGELFGLVRDKFTNQGLRGSALRQAILDELYPSDISQQEAEQTARTELYGPTPPASLTSKEQSDLDVRTVELLRKSIDPTLVAQAERYGQVNTYKGKATGIGGLIAQAFSKATDNPLIAVLVKLGIGIDFVNIGFNITNRALNFVPGYGHLRAFNLGISNIAFIQEYLDKAGVESTAQYEGPSRERSQQLARANVATLVALGTLGLALKGLDDEEWEKTVFDVTGPSSLDFKQANADKQLRPPTSFRIGGGPWINYTLIPGLNVAMALSGATKDYMRHHGKTDKEGKLLNKADMQNRYQLALLMGSMQSIRSAVVDASPLRNMLAYYQQQSSGKEKEAEDLAELTQQIYKEYGKSAITKAAGSASQIAFPNLLRQIARVYDPTIYSPKTVQGMLLKTFGIINLAPEGVKLENAVYDPFGRRVKFYPGEQSLPYQHWAGELGNDPVDKLVYGTLRLPIQNASPNAQVVLKKSDGKYEPHTIGEDRAFYNQYVIRSGQAAYKAIEALINDNEAYKAFKALPEKVQQQRVRDLVAKHRGLIRDAMQRDLIRGKVRFNAK